MQVEFALSEFENYFHPPLENPDILESRLKNLNCEAVEEPESKRQKIRKFKIDVTSQLKEYLGLEIEQYM